MILNEFDSHMKGFGYVHKTANNETFYLKESANHSVKISIANEKISGYGNDIDAEIVVIRVYTNVNPDVWDKYSMLLSGLKLPVFMAKINEMELKILKPVG